jgi:hypothetical protein
VPTAVHRVGAHVDDVNGYSHCVLTVLPGEVRLRLGGPLVRVFAPRMHGKVLTHRGPDITVARIRWEVPWLRAALLMPSPEHRALIPLSRGAADVLVEELTTAGFRVAEVPVGYVNGAAALLTDLSWQLIGNRRRTDRRPPS